MYRKDLLVMFLGFFFLGLTVFGALDYVSTSQHEAVHRQIDEYFGCENITVAIRLWGTSYTRCEDVRNVSLEEWSMHAYNEVVAYNNVQVVLAIFFCTFWILTFIFCMYVYHGKD